MTGFDNPDLMSQEDVDYMMMQNQQDGMIQILPEEIFIYEKALQDLEFYDDVDKPAQKITLLMGPKKPIDYENLTGLGAKSENLIEKKNRCHGNSNSNKLNPIEMGRSSKM